MHFTIDNWYLYFVQNKSILFAARSFVSLFVAAFLAGLWRSYF